MYNCLLPRSFILYQLLQLLLVFLCLLDESVKLPQVSNELALLLVVFFGPGEQLLEVLLPQLLLLVAERSQSDGMLLLLAVQEDGADHRVVSVLDLFDGTLQELEALLLLVQRVHQLLLGLLFFALSVAPTASLQLGELGGFPFFSLTRLIGLLEIESVSDRDEPELELLAPSKEEVCVSLRPSRALIVRILGCSDRHVLDHIPILLICVMEDLQLFIELGKGIDIVHFSLLRPMAEFGAILTRGIFKLVVDPRIDTLITILDRQEDLGNLFTSSSLGCSLHSILIVSILAISHGVSSSLGLIACVCRHLVGKDLLLVQDELPLLVSLDLRDFFLCHEGEHFTTDVRRSLRLLLFSLLLENLIQSDLVTTFILVLAKVEYALQVCARRHLVDLLVIFI